MADLVAGASEVVNAAKKPGASFDYDRSIAGLKATDRYTLQFKFNEVNYALVENFLDSTLAVAREVVESAHGNIQTRPVGTGPYRLKEWKRGSRVILEANADYRSIPFPRPTPETAGLARGMESREFPRIGTIDISVIAEDLPALLEFERGRLDYVEPGGAVAERLLVNGRLASAYASRGIKHYAFSDARLNAMYFNLNDPVVGGLDPQHIALRRAIALALDVDTLIKIIDKGRALPAGQLVPPGLSPHDPTVQDKSRYNPAAANALLDRFGFDKRDREAYRLAPGGKPLTLTYSTRVGIRARDEEALWKKNVDAIGLRMRFRELQRQDLLKEQDTGQFQISSRSVSDNNAGFLILLQFYGKSPSALNTSRFQLPEYDRAMQQFMRTNDGAERMAAARKMSELVQYYTPIIPVTFVLRNDFAQPWVQGFHPWILGAGNYWKYLDIGPRP